MDIPIIVFILQINIKTTRVFLLKSAISMITQNSKYYSGGESDGADAEYIYVNYMVDPNILIDPTILDNESLHLCTFKTPPLGAVMSEQGDADCALKMRNGVKIKEYTPKPNTNTNTIEGENPVSYKIITNDNSTPMGELSQYRSVVFTSPENELVSFSPPAGISVEEFRGKYPEITDDIYVNECIEGTMLSLFYDPRIKKWELASKGAVGANYWYYRTQYQLGADANIPESNTQSTFREMFLDVFRATKGEDLDSLAFLEYFPKEYSYTFVIQHPENHIVQYIENPVVYLVAIYHICDNRAIYIPPIIYEEWDCFFNIRGLLEFPRIYDNTNYDDYMTQSDNNPFFMGYMLTNIRTGERCHIENISYEYLRELRSNHPNLQYQYYCLIASGRVHEFLHYFPQYLPLFNQFRIQYLNFVTHIHGLYLTNYIQRTGEKCPAKYFPLVYKLHHEVFIPSMAAGAKLVMRKPVVDEFLSRLSPGALLHYLSLPKCE